ncbi:Protein phosphatase 1 regulatory subunit 3A [Lachnellula arida]|uniref:Protein phosphatase 1 regulatory subunit 3A n=1 Tax=Lachnellula arida TaxID=1316785 RepID=A0A8T9BFL0_9HELO|nr:Protein phosphatase 1 regulatory subunit 3A [Lachnellula arida]
MPYTPPSQRSPAVSTPHSPSLSRRSSYQPGHQHSHSHSHSRSHSHSLPGHSDHSVLLSPRPELPRSTSYLTRHRRTASVKTAAFAPNPIEPTPPGSADNEKGGKNGLNASASLRQSPPPVTDDSQIPTGAVISPPDSTLNSSDDEDTKDRGRELVNEAELRAAISTIEQHRDGSPIRTAEEISKANQHLTLIMPSTKTEDKPTTAHVEKALTQTIRKISHNRSHTDSAVFVDLQPSQAPETPLTGSDEESLSDGDDPDRSRRKPPMLRKKSGELVRPALRPSSAKRRPSSMPGTPTFGKAVHFDSHLEHVRHFLQVDRPLAVSAGSSPVEAYDSDTEFPFGAEGTTGKAPPFEWEIIVSNFPPETPQRLSLPVRVERVFLSSDNKTLIGSVAVANLAFNKHVVARFTLDYWKTTSEVVAEFNNDVRQPKFADGYDRFNFNIKLADQANLEAKTMFFCVKYSVNGQEYWDNNNSTNFQVDFRKKAKPQNGKKGTQGAGSRPAHSLPRSHKKSQASGRTNSINAAFDDFADGHFDSKYKLDDYKQPVHDFMGETGTPLRLKGVQSAINLGSDNLTRRAPQPNGQAFGNRYDFGASLSAAISAANSVMGDRSGITMKSAPKKQPVKFMTGPEDPVSPRTVTSEQSSTQPPVNKAIASDQPSSSGTDSPRPVGTEKPQLASQSYNELLDKYCFFGSVKSSPQLKEGTLKSGQLDGSNDDGYVLGSTESTADSSPLMTEKTSPPRTQTASVRASRSTSPAPMTGFVTGTSPMYHNMHNGFPFRDTYTATAIRG